MFIVKPTLSEEEIKKVVENFGKVLTDNGATITESKEIGQRELAYEIKKFKSGYYYLYTVEANDDVAVKEFDRLAGISSDVIRHLITKLEK
jgi:small subunit ribosomal protein S6